MVEMPMNPLPVMANVCEALEYAMTGSLLLLMATTDEIMGGKNKRDGEKATCPLSNTDPAGALEILLAVAILAGLWKTLSYGLGLALHAVSTLVTYRELLAPFGENHLFLAAIPALAAFIALFLLRRHDTFWNVSRAPGTGDG